MSRHDSPASGRAKRPCPSKLATRSSTRAAAARGGAAHHGQSTPERAGRRCIETPDARRESAEQGRHAVGRSADADAGAEDPVRRRRSPDARPSAASASRRRRRQARPALRPRSPPADAAGQARRRQPPAKPAAGEPAKPRTEPPTAAGRGQARPASRACGEEAAPAARRRRPRARRQAPHWSGAGRSRLHRRRSTLGDPRRSQEQRPADRPGGRQPRPHQRGAAASALAEQNGLKVVNLAEAKPQPEAMALVPETMADVYKILPLSVKDKVLTIAIGDPSNMSSVDDLRNLLSLNEVDRPCWRRRRPSPRPGQVLRAARKRASWT